MDAAFWLHRWREGRDRLAPRRSDLQLARLWAKLEPPPAGRVLVSLCGNSRDLDRLAGQGQRVLGVKISPLAVEAFFREQRVIPTRHELAPFQSSERRADRHPLRRLFRPAPGPAGSGGRVLRLRFPDSFACAAATTLRRASGRAAVHRQARPAGELGVSAAQRRTDHPFAVNEDEVHALLRPHFRIRLLHTLDALENNPKLAERGRTRLQEKAYILRRR